MVMHIYCKPFSIPMPGAQDLQADPEVWAPQARWDCRCFQAWELAISAKKETGYQVGDWAKLI